MVTLCLEIIDIRATTVTIPLDATLRHINGAPIHLNYKTYDERLRIQLQVLYINRYRDPGHSDWHALSPK